MGAITIVGSAQDATNKIINREPLTFHVSFPYRYPIPKVVRIVYDGNLLCTGPEGNKCLFYIRILLKQYYYIYV